MSSAEAATTEKKPARRTVTKKTPKAENEAAASPAPAVAVPKKRKAPAKKEVVDVAAPVADAETSTASKRARAPKTPRNFIVAFGDLAKEEKDRDFSKEEFERWKAQTAEAVANIRFKEWERSKREFYRAIKKLQKKKKRTTKGYNWEATAENHLRRLKELPKEDFAELDGAWLSNYQFSGSFGADALNKDGCPEKGAIPTFTVYLAAIHHGYKPAGIVSENGTKNGTEISFTTPVDGKRVYVGVALPFQNKDRSKFCVVPKDRVLNDA